MADANRNLLFGILALQVDFVSREDLIAAMQAWIKEKHKALGEILVERGALSAKFRELLEPMVDAHVERNGGDPAMSLAALSSSTSAVAPLTVIEDPDVKTSLALVATDPSSGADTLATRPPEAMMLSALRSRFRVLRPHARGGIGEVFVAHDQELNREVALKEIQDRHADHEPHRARFLLEAEVTGGLEHPGIVPVYGLGKHPDGRPYYAMRFIRGDSLKEAIEQFHRGDGRGDAERALSLQKLLRRFLDVCDAISYAHSRGVLHRDLKPGNIMLGKYGETLVVDWGLAKARGRPDLNGDHDHGESPLSPRSAGESEETLPGSTIGTPAYMSPEQAAGELGRLGPASDVYSLGATLYSLLTGRVPFQGAAGEVLGKVQRGEFPRPRAVDPSVAPALEAICLKAMATRPEDRYSSPRALSDDLERWLADEPVSAYRDPWTAPVARFCRRHRSTVVPGAGLLIGLLLGWGLLLHYRAKWTIAEVERAREVAQAAEKQRVAEEDRNAARREARIRDGFAAIDRAREARTARRPGWTWAVLEELAKARAANVGDPATLRGEAASALASLDVRRRAVFDPKLSVLDPRIVVGWPAHHFAFSPDGRRLAAIGYRPSSRVFYAGKILDAETGSVVRSLQFLAKSDPLSLVGELQAVEDVAFSHDGRWLTVVTSSGQAHLWDESSPSADGLPSITWDAHRAKIERAAFAVGALFTLADDRELRRWEIPDEPKAIPRLTHTFRAERSLERALEVGEGPTLRVVADGAVLRLDPASLAIRERTPVDPARHEFGWALPGPDGLRCAGIKGWEVGLLGLDAEPPLKLESPRLFRGPEGGETSLRFDPDGSLLLATFKSDRERGVRLWDLASGASIATLTIRGHHTIGAAYSPDGRQLVISEEKKIASYEVRAGDVRSAIAHAGGPIRAFSVSPDGSRMTCVATTQGPSAASAFETTTWDLARGKRLDRVVFPGRGSAGEPDSASVDHHPAGSATLMTGNDTKLFLRASGDDSGWRPSDAGGKQPRAVFSGDGRRIWGIARGTDGHDRVVMVDWESGKLTEVWHDRLSNLNSGLAGLNAISAAGSSVVVGAHNGTCYHFRDGASTGEPEAWLAPRDPVTALSLSNDGAWAILGRQSGALEIRRVDGTVEPYLLPQAHGDAVGAVALAPDGRTLASGSTDRTIRLWRQTGSTWGDPITLSSEAAPVVSLAFSPDGRRLYALTEGEAAIRAWHLDRLRDHLAQIGLPWEGFASPADAR